MLIKHIALAAALLSSLTAYASAANPGVPRLPDTIPVCNSPQPLNLPQAAGAGGGPVMVFNGQDYAAVYVSSGNSLYFRRYFADGTPAGAPKFIASTTYYVFSASAYTRPALVWTGTNYGVAWLGLVSSKYVPFFARLNTDGAMIGAPVQAGFVGSTPTADAVQLALAWGGPVSSYVLAWSDDRNTAPNGRDLFFTVLGANGTISGTAGAYHDLPATVGRTNTQDYPALAWNDTGGWFALAWQDHRSGTKDEIYSNVLSSSGSIGYGADNLQISASGNATVPALVTAGSGIGMSWTDTRSGSQQVYFARLNFYGQKLSVDLAVGQPGSFEPAIAWFGSEYGVSWSYNGEPWFQRVSTAGAALGASVNLSPGYYGYYPALATGRLGYLLLASDNNNTGFGNLNAISVGCALDSTPPDCPANLSVTTVSPYSVGVNWLPATDAETDLAYYQVLVNNVPAQKTSATSATLGGLTAGASYNVTVQPVNAAQLQNGACTASVTAVTSPVNSCNAVQPGAPVTLNPAAVINSRAAIVYNGTNFATVYNDNTARQLTFQLLNLDGSPAAAPVQVAFINNSGYSLYAPGLVWNGAGYGVVWQDTAAPFSFKFMRLTTAGQPVAAPLSISAGGGGWWYGMGSSIALAWNGSIYAAAWSDARVSPYPIYATLLDNTGAIAGSGAYHDIPIATDSLSHFRPSVVWSGLAGKFQVVWEATDGTNAGAVFTSQLDPATGTTNTATEPVVLPVGKGLVELHAVDTPTGPGVVWMDGRNSVTQIYFARLDATGALAAGPVRVNNTANTSYHPQIVWTGGELAAFWNENDSSGVSHVWMQRLAPDGTLKGTMLAVAPGRADALHMPGAAWANGEYVVTTQPYNSGTGGAPLGLNVACANDSTPPTCPGNLLAYNVSGTQATVSWSMAGDPESGIGQYILYRNNAELARTQANVNVYTDTGLGLSTPYNYMVQPVNNSGVQNFSCTASVYVKTSASLTLTLGKSAPDAQLNWTDAGLNSYTIFRGSSPQVMSLIGSTPSLSAPDPNVLNDGMSYFYTVDDPGQ